MIIIQIIYCLKNQMSNRVRWTESIKNLEKAGESKIIEIDFRPINNYKPTGNLIYGDELFKKIEDKL